MFGEYVGSFVRDSKTKNISEDKRVLGSMGVKVDVLC